MNTSGVFYLDAPLVMFYLYVFNGVGLLTLLGMALAFMLLSQSKSRRLGFIGLGLCTAPAFYFFLMPRAVRAMGQELPQSLQLFLLGGFGVACLAAPCFGGIALRRRQRGSA